MDGVAFADKFVYQFCSYESCRTGNKDFGGFGIDAHTVMAMINEEKIAFKVAIFAKRDNATASLVLV